MHILDFKKITKPLQESILTTTGKIRLYSFKTVEASSLDELSIDEIQFDHINMMQFCDIIMYMIVHIIPKFSA